VYISSPSRVTIQAILSGVFLCKKRLFMAFLLAAKGGPRYHPCHEQGVWAMAEILTIDFLNPIPLFALRDCVLLPHTIIPLHIFEPRYRRMVKDALDADGLIAMGLFANDVDEDEYLDGAPSVRPCVCVGHIRHYDEFPDGRYLILLQGTCRARVISEAPRKAYRRIMVEPLDLEPRESHALTAFRSRILALAHDSALDRHESAARIRKQLEPGRSSAAVIDGIIAALIEDAEKRYDMLAELNPVTRATWLIRHLEKLRSDLLPQVS
jgi:Lon protease-like protein